MRTASDPLDQILLGFSQNDPFTVRDSLEGVQIFGGTGSGKTSGSGAHIARAYLRAGYGGLVLTAKIDEVDIWRQYARETNRLDDLIIVGPDAKHRFNFLTYEQQHPDADAGLTENIVRLFETVASPAKSHAASTGTDTSFWIGQYRQMMGNAIDIIRFAGKPLTLETIYKVITSAPLSIEQARSLEWQTQSLCHQTVVKACERDDAGLFTAIEKHDFEMTLDFWTRDFPTQVPKTRASTLQIVGGATRAFLRGMLYQIFGTDITFRPEDCFTGKIIVLNLAEKRFREVGIDAQNLFRLCWQRAVERRPIAAGSRPLFMWIDEAQLFVNKHDPSFQTTCRSARVASVYLTQNLPNYYAALGGEAAAKPLVDSLLGNLTTKIFHHNTCATTNHYAAEIFAKDWMTDRSGSFSENQGNVSSSTSLSNRLEYSILPRDFTTLARGGTQHNCIVQAIVYQGGKVFAESEMNALLVNFHQLQKHE